LSTQEARRYRDADPFLILWRDSYEKRGWWDKEPFLERMKEEDDDLFLIRTVGWIIFEGNNLTVVAASESFSQFSDINVIPNCCIAERRQLDERTRSPGRAKKKR